MGPSGEYNGRLLISSAVVLREPCSRDVVVYQQIAESLCRACRYVKPIISGKGSVFIQCQLYFSDKRFAKYPELPVQYCSGFESLQEEPKEIDCV